MAPSKNAGRGIRCAPTPVHRFCSPDSLLHLLALLLEPLVLLGHSGLLICGPLADVVVDWSLLVQGRQLAAVAAAFLAVCQTGWSRGRRQLAARFAAVQAAAAAAVQAAFAALARLVLKAKRKLGNFKKEFIVSFAVLDKTLYISEPLNIKN